MYFFGLNILEALKGWIDCDGKVYYADPNTGVLFQGGVKEVEGEHYFFGMSTGAVQKGMVGYDGQWYYAEPERGVLQSGLLKIDGNGYYFDPETYQAQEGLIKLNGKIYYGQSGSKVLSRGLTQVGDQLYFFGLNILEALKGWIDYDGKIYYANDDYVLVTGSQYIDQNYYNFGKNGELETGWQDINGKTYYFYADGSRATFISKIAGVRYEFSATGELQYSNVKLIIDVSSWQGEIDWERLWNSGEIDGVILRIAAGCELEDAMLASYIENVKRLGIPYGIYIYSYAENYDEGVLYANFTQNVINKYGLNPTLGVYLDLESNSITSYMGVAEYENVVRGFMSVLPNAKVYTYSYYANTALNSDYIRPYITWIANYDVTDRPGNYQGWQYTSSASAPGINGNVDMSIFYW